MTKANTILSASVHEAIAAHLERIVPLLLASFGEIPLTYVTYPQGFDHAAVYHRSLEQAPATISTVPVRTSSGIHPYITLSAPNVAWLARDRFAIELQSWSPTATDPDRATFARITIEPAGTATFADVERAVLTLRTALQAQNLDAIPLLDGGRGYALWIPFANAPSYPELVTWLHAFVADVVAAHPDQLTAANLRADRGNRVVLGTRSNHPGMMSVLPYSCRGSNGLPIAIPARWSEIGSVRNGTVTAANFPKWLTQHGDRFAEAYAKLGKQTLPTAGSIDRNVTGNYASYAALSLITQQTHPDGVLSGALTVLADGKPLTPEQILSDGIARGVFSASLTRKHLYTDLYEYVMRTQGAGKTPDIIHDDATKTFRLNRPVDLWPAVTLPPLPRWLDDTAIAALGTRLTATAVGEDPAAFEQAVCDAFAALGFAATHIGGNAAPDGTLDAALGEAGYRIILECKTTKPDGIVNNPRPEEPASFLGAYHGQKALLIGQAFSNEATLKSELLTHKVALWTVDDLITVLQEQIGPRELLPLLEPGIARTALDALIWERNHGRRKRIAVIAERIFATAWQMQIALAGKLAPADTPPITRDALMLIIDEAIVHEGIITGINPAEYDTAFKQLIASGSLHLVSPEMQSIVAPQPYRG